MALGANPKTTQEKQGLLDGPRQPETPCDTGTHVTVTKTMT